LLKEELQQVREIAAEVAKEEIAKVLAEFEKRMAKAKTAREPQKPDFTFGASK